MATNDPKAWSDSKVVKEMQRDTRINRVRKMFSGWSAKIEQAGQQRTPLSPIERRRMEFLAAKELIDQAIKVPGS
jgi:hypothetical protein